MPGRFWENRIGDCGELYERGFMADASGESFRERKEGDDRDNLFGCGRSGEGKQLCLRRQQRGVNSLSPGAPESALPLRRKRFDDQTGFHRHADDSASKERLSLYERLASRTRDLSGDRKTERRGLRAEILEMDHAGDPASAGMDL